MQVHLAGAGDFKIAELAALPDPCPLPSTVKRKGLNEREKLLYAPMASLGDLFYDKDALYLDIPQGASPLSSFPTLPLFFQFF